VQQCSSAAVQQYSIAAVQQCSSAAVQHLDVSVDHIRLYSEVDIARAVAHIRWILADTPKAATSYAAAEANVAVAVVTRVIGLQNWWVYGGCMAGMVWWV
jgi:hypothetical protein